MKNFEFIKCGKFEDLYEVRIKVYQDSRGYNLESYSEKEFFENGLNMKFVQDNYSVSSKNVLRGMHFQRKYQQGKLVRVIKGEVFDAVVDLRKGSKTYGEWHGLTLSGEKNNMLYVPEGFAHGFFVLSDTAEFSYKLSDFYHPEDEGGIPWNDPDVGIVWPITGYRDVITSERDDSHLSFAETIPLDRKENRNELDTLTKLSMELQSIAQNGLTYTKDLFDKERFERIRDISAEIMAIKTEYPIGKIKDLFCNEVGYQTPKLETRAVIFNENKILLVKEKEKWSLPGGWIDYNESIASNTVKEVKEEAGLDVEPVKVIAIQNRNKHNFPKYAYEICKVFVICVVRGGSFRQNNETTESGYFSLNNLPVLDEDKNVYSQIKMCFDAYENDKWNVIFD